MRNLTPHSIRHTGITHDINLNGRPLSHVQADAGHDSIDTTSSTCTPATVSATKVPITNRWIGCTTRPFKMRDNEREVQEHGCDDLRF